MRPHPPAPRRAVALLCLFGGMAAAPQASAAILSVRVSAFPAKTILHLQPGFATVLRADRQVETVAIGDPRLVTATTVKRGADVYDVVLQPQAPVGSTNMVVWLGETTSVWELIIGPGLRTADIVYIVTTPPAAGRDGPIVQTSAAAVPAPRAGAPTPAETPPGPGRIDSAPPRGTAPTPAAHLDAQQTLKDAAGAFELWRTSSGVSVRYRVSNQSDRDLVIRPNSVVLRANGRTVPFAIAIDGGGRARRDVVAPGATGTGLITAVTAAPRDVEVIFSMFPAPPTAGGGVRSIPTIFQLRFVDLQQLAPIGKG